MTSRFRAGLGHVDRWESAIRIVFEFFDANRAGETTTTWQSTIVIEEIRVLLEIKDSWMVGKTASLDRHNYALECPRTGGVGARRITDILRDAAGRKHHTIQAIPLVKPRALLVKSGALRVAIAFAETFFGQWNFNHSFVSYAGLKGDHVLVQFYVPKVGVTPIQIRLTIVIDVNCRINITRAGRHQGMPERVLERSGRVV